ncbi:transglycosylase SLT domain-containing protein [Thalassotalea sp. LPB0316]|uniref:transglycosylase SLT domain-containing protein n=1 Tax=Thalassotalea sp. LPB0316 TaxID=2769490 RepID=UPI0018669B43|nr:transglycosylase SLT domain-containing protein [Thalassotalea sp. LPB0316]QOL26399.1 transglycosylase SLT domain-containing protein [Thalassotalea sp. LPB0316]
MSYSSDAAKQDNQYYRDLFKQAERLTHRAQSAEYKALYQQLHFYPLQPYLDQQRLIKTMHINNANNINEFLARYQGTPLDWPLRKQWLTYLAKKNYPSLFIDAFKLNSDAKLMCYMYKAQLKTGVPAQEVLPLVTDLWVVGKSQPKECDSLFEQWQQAGYRTQEVIWQRLTKAADGGNHTMIPYITGLLEPEQQYLGKLWHSVRRNPSYVTNLNRFPQQSVRETQILTYGLNRLVWRNQDLAIKVYREAKDLFPFSTEQHQLIEQKFALALASKGHQSAKQWLVKVDDSLQSGQVIQWRISQMLRDDNWQSINQQLAQFPEHVKETLQWKYWYARSLIETEQSQSGNQLLTELAKERHYYGFLAASHLSQDIVLNDQPLVISVQERQSILQSDSAKRAFELFYLGRPTMARKEWNHWRKSLTKRERLVAAKVANEAGWYDRAIFTLAYEGYLNDVDLRFPLAYQETIVKQATKNQISPPWAFAIARRESSFMPDAHSGAGARGVMQIMPATARHVARRPVSTRKLNDPEQNIALGTKYLKQLLDKHNQNQILATAAYNAGSSRVNRWLKETPTLAADIWIETIPFKETREYVKSVMAYQQIYREKTNQKESLFAMLIAMEI